MAASDGTSRIAAAAGAAWSAYRTTAARGSPYEKGWSAARGDVVVMLDADGQDDPAEIPTLLLAALTDDVGMVVGFRFPRALRRGEHHPPQRPAGTVLPRSSCLNVLFATRMTDTLAGFKAMRTSRLRGLRLEARRYDIEVELLVQLLRAGARVVDIPVRRAARVHGTSRLDSFRDGTRAPRWIVRLRLEGGWQARDPYADTVAPLPVVEGGPERHRVRHRPSRCDPVPLHLPPPASPRRLARPGHPLGGHPGLDAGAARSALSRPKRRLDEPLHRRRLRVRARKWRCLRTRGGGSLRGLASRVAQSRALSKRPRGAPFPELAGEIGVPEHLVLDAGWRDARLSIGADGTTTPIHAELTHNLLAVICGEKELALFAPWQSRALYFRPLSAAPHISPVDPYVLDCRRFPRTARATPWRALVRSGDVLFLPRGWWHAVRTNGVTVAHTSWWAGTV